MSEYEEGQYPTTAEVSDVKLLKKSEGYDSHPKYDEVELKVTFTIKTRRGALEYNGLLDAEGKQQADGSSKLYSWEKMVVNNETFGNWLQWGDGPQ